MKLSKPMRTALRALYEGRPLDGGEWAVTLEALRRRGLAQVGPAGAWEVTDQGASVHEKGVVDCPHTAAPRRIYRIIGAVPRPDMRACLACVRAVQRMGPGVTIRVRKPGGVWVRWEDGGDG